MTFFALNHITLAHASGAEMLDVAAGLGCRGVELRMDVEAPLFDGRAPQEFGALAQGRGLRILALAEVPAFNAAGPQAIGAVHALAAQAAASGAEGIALIPEVAAAPVSRDRQRDMLRAALEQIAPVLRAANICGLIEPLGFETSTLRFKQDVVETLHALDMTDCFSLIHDTFHHALSGEQALFAANTQIVHMSGALRRDVPIGALRDADRGLVGPDDRLETCRQVADLKAAGYAGPLSFEAFDPAVHAVPDPAQALAASITFMTSHTAGIAA